MPKRIGFDVGGTFTDFVLKDEETGELDVYKYPTTVDDPSQGVLTGLDEFLTEVDSEIDDLEQLIHATTLATNTVLERDGADTALLTTEGFRTYRFWADRNATICTIFSSRSPIRSSTGRTSTRLTSVSTLERVL